MATVNHQLKLLPNYFKKIGVVMFLLPVVLLVVISFGNGSLADLSHVQLQLIFDGMLLGLLIFNMSKEKVEDEFIQLLRTKAIIWSFFYVILGFVFSPFVSYLMGQEIIEMKGIQLILSMLLGYLVMFSYLKWKNK